MNRMPKPYPYPPGRGGPREQGDNYHPGPPRGRTDDYYRNSSRGGRGRGGRGGSWSHSRPSERGNYSLNFEPHSNRSGFRGRTDTYSHGPYPDPRLSSRNPNRAQLGQDTSYKSGPGKYSRKNPDNKEQREFPCRCLFVRNIEKFETTERDIHELFSGYGEIKMIADKIFDTGVAYISFFDLRAAESARNSLNGANFKGRPLDVHFAFPNPKADRTLPPPPKESQGSIKLVLRGFSHIPVHEQLFDYFAQFGDVKDVRPTSNPTVYILSYYDCRACFEVVRNTPANAFGEGTALVDLAWDKFLYPRDAPRQTGSHQGDNYSYDFKEPYSHNSSGARGYNHQSYNEAPNSTHDLIEKAQQAQELLNYIQTQTAIKLPESNNYYNGTSQQTHPDKSSSYYQNTLANYAPTESHSYYSSTPNATNTYGYSSTQPSTEQSSYYSSGKPTHSENTYGYYPSSQDVSSNRYQTPSTAQGPQENPPNTEVNQLLQLLAQANSKHGIK